MGIAEDLMDEIDASSMDFVEFLLWEVENTLLTSGWWQHGIRGPKGETDLLGAITDVAAIYHNYGDVYGYDEYKGPNGKLQLVEDLKRIVGAPLGPNGKFLAPFNDAKTTTLGTIIQTLQMAREMYIHSQYRARNALRQSLQSDSVLPMFAD